MITSSKRLPFIIIIIFSQFFFHSDSNSVICSIKSQTNSKLTCNNGEQSKDIQKCLDSFDKYELGYDTNFCLNKRAQLYEINTMFAKRFGYQRYKLVIDQDVIDSKPEIYFLYGNALELFKDFKKEQNQLKILQNGKLQFLFPFRGNRKTLTFNGYKLSIPTIDIITEDYMKIKEKFYEYKEKTNKIINDLLKENQNIKKQLSVINELKAQINDIKKKITKNQTNVLLKEDLINYEWSFYNDGGFIETVRFLQNGKFLDSYESQRAWTLSSKGILSIFGVNNKLSTVYIQNFKDNRDKWILQGKFVYGLPSFNSWRHYLVQQRKIK